jgi:hypothetical protein
LKVGWHQGDRDRRRPVFRHEVREAASSQTRVVRLRGSIPSDRYRYEVNERYFARTCIARAYDRTGDDQYGHAGSMPY